MKNTSWKDIAELIGMTAIVLSLLFVGLQLRQSQQLAVEEGINYSNERQNAIRELIVTNAEIWQKACAGEPLDPVSRIIAAKIFDAWLDHEGARYILLTDGVYQSDKSRQRLVEELAAQFWIYPGLRELNRSRGEWQNGSVEASSSFSEFGTLIRSRVEELFSSGIKPEIDTAWCGRT